MADATPPPATQAFSDVHLAAPTRKCSRCGERFLLGARRGRNSDKRHANAARSYHLGARYCSDTCRKLASKARCATQPSPVGEQKQPVGGKKQRGATNVLSTVTSAGNSIVTSIACENDNQGRASPRKPVLDPRIVPDPKWPGMYRVRRPDGSLSNMMNLTRAKDALVELWRGRP
jgi:hypothetical protein